MRVNIFKGYGSNLYGSRKGIDETDSLQEFEIKPSTSRISGRRHKTEQLSRQCLTTNCRRHFGA
jgi:hypothetical protein